MTAQQTPGASVTPSRIHGDSEMARMVRSHDWSKTALGDMEQWSIDLLTAVNLVLGSPVHMQLLWGPEFIVFYNDAFMPQIGSKHPDALGRPGAQVWREVWDQVCHTLQATMLRGEVTDQHAATIPIDRNGRVEDSFWDYSYSPIYIADGTIGGVLNISHEVTKEVLAQRSLQASEAQAVRVLASIGDAVIVADADARVSRMNTVAETLTGWTEREACGLPLPQVFRIVNESTRLPVEDPAAKVHRLGTVVGLANHTILIHRDGTETHIDDSGAPIRDDAGNLIGVVLVFRDINERRALERERLEAANNAQLDRKRLLAIFQQAPAVFALLEGPEHRIAMVNPAYLRLVGRDDVIGKTMRESMPEAVDQGYVALLDQVFRTATSVSGNAARVEVRPGPNVPVEERYVDFVYQPLLEQDSTVSGIILLGVDVTERKKAEAGLLQSEKLAAVGRLAASIAHEINNPLESITNLIYLARSTAISSQAIEYLETADQELRRVAAIANQTLRFHKQSTNPTALQPAQLFDSVLSIYQGRLANSGVVVELRGRSALTVLGFGGEIRQVLSNLAGNSIDAMRGGGRLLLRYRAATDWRSGRKGLTLTVADNGSGMSAHTLQHAFEPFYTTKGIGGTGLGLWISKEILDRHTGRLLVRSSQRSGRSGTVTTLFLPFDAPTRALPAAESA